MSFSQLLSILRARWKIVLAAFVLTFATAMVISALLTKKYTASASVVVDYKSPDPISGMVLQGGMLPSYIATQIDILVSERVARKVIDSLRLGASPQLREQWQQATEGRGVFEAWLAELLLKNLDVRPSKESSVITVSYEASDPNFAAAVANAFVQSYIDTTLDLRIEPARQFTRLFEEQMRQGRNNLEQAQSRLSAYQNEKGIIATDERLDVETARLNELSAQLVSMQSQTADAVSRKTNVGPNSPDVLNSPVVAGLRADIARQEAKLQEFTAKYGAAHPQVVELQANLRELKQRVDAEMRNVTSSVHITSSTSQQREGQVRAALEAQRQKVLRLKQQRDEAAVLIQDVESAQRSLEGIQNRYNVTSLESQSNQSNVSLLKAASPPSEASSPKMVLNGVLAAFIGLLLGITGALGIELVDRRLRSPEDVTSLSGGLVLGVMPVMDGSESKKLLPVVRGTPKLANARALPELGVSKA